MRTFLRKVKWNKGNFEGRDFDYTRIYVEAPVYDQQQNEFGVDTVELEFGKEADHVKLLHLRGKLPVLVDVDFTLVKKGKDNIQVVNRLDVLEDKAIHKDSKLDINKKEF